LNKRNKTTKKEFKAKIPMPTKNKWLNPTDNFGKLERGVV